MDFDTRTEFDRQQRLMSHSPQGYVGEYNSQPAGHSHAVPSTTAPYPLQHHTDPVSWPSEEPRGLGLYPTSITMDHFRPTCGVDATDGNMSFNWPTTYMPTSQSMLSQADNQRRSPWSDCDPMSTMLPSTVWHMYDDHHHHGSDSMTMDGHPSPSQSEYSASSRPSCTSSPYSHAGHFMPTAGSPRVKTEDPVDFSTENLAFLTEVTQFGHTKLVNPEDLVTQPPSSTGRPTFVRHPSYNDLLDVTSISPSRRGRPSTQRAFSSEGTPFSVLEDRQKRGFTKPENASCSCEKCGKLFQRSYNLKAHMETHDPHRSQPHVCQYAGCTKRFVRRTDLLRHEQSVHVKAKIYTCPLCDSSFARKDTLRRHVDDGCPKRPEVKKRVSKSSTRRGPNVSSLRRPSFQQLAEASLSSSSLRQPLRLH